jgi:PucR C-terminal helix-turn-helix domain/GGDEF-like domain
MQTRRPMTNPTKTSDGHINVVQRLRSKGVEIENAIVQRIHNITSDTAGCEWDLQYKERQRRTVMAILEYALISIEQGDKQTLPIPHEALVQAHRAARSGVGLGTILRCYTAGYVLIESFVIQEVVGDSLFSDGAVLRSVQAKQASLLDDLMVSVSEEYIRETRRVGRSPQQLRAELVRRLLAGEILDTEQIGYKLDAWHLGIIGTGARVGQAIQRLAASLDSRLLYVSHDEDNVWVWLGGDSKQLVVGDIKRLLSTNWPVGVSLALGEPAEGLKGWRLTHWQAQNAWLVSLHHPQRFTDYSNIALLAPWLKDGTYARWLIDMYLSPLDSQKVAGETLRETLREFFAAGRNASAAASALKVSRRTMRNRMDLIEQALGTILIKRQAELELALRLENIISLSQISTA